MGFFRSMRQGMPETLRLAPNAGATRAVGDIDLKGVPIPIEAYTAI